MRRDLASSSLLYSLEFAVPPVLQHQTFSPGLLTPLQLRCRQSGTVMRIKKNVTKKLNIFLCIRQGSLIRNLTENFIVAQFLQQIAFKRVFPKKNRLGLEPQSSSSAPFPYFCSSWHLAKVFGILGITEITYEDQKSINSRRFLQT